VERGRTERACRACVVTALVALLAPRPAAAEQVAVFGYGAAEPPVEVRAATEAVAAAARGHGAEVVVDPFARAAARLARGAVPAARLEVFDRATALAAEGWRAYLAVEIEFAVARLAEARRVAEQALPIPGGALLYADVSLRRGVVLLYLGRAAEAADAFRVARSLDPGREVTMAEFPPEVVAAWEAASEAPVTVRLTITADAPEAELEVDGVAIGAAPQEVSLAAGEHVVVARAPGHWPAARAFAATPAAEVVIALDPRPAAQAVARGPGALALGSGERDAAVVVEALVDYAELDAVVLIASVWRRGAPALLGQRCTGVPVRCTRVVEIGFPNEAGLRAAAAALWRALGGEALTLAPVLLQDVRVVRGERPPGTVVDVREPRCRWCRSPWLWVGVGAAALAGGAVVVLTREADVRPVITIPECEFGCPVTAR
jgi:hypothetical protein